MKAEQLPVGTRVEHAGRSFTRDRLGAQGWWCYPVGAFMDFEIDAKLADGASMHLPAEAKETR